MSTKENVKIDFLKLLNDYSSQEAAEHLTNIVNTVANKYGDEKAVIDVLESIDREHEGLISFQIAVDGLYNITTAGIRDSRNALSFDGKDYLESHRY